MDLLDIMEPVKQIATAISTVLTLDVEIINSAYVRVAGTGKYASDLGKKIKLNNIYKYVVANKIDVLIANPREDELCAPCPNKYCCQEYAELSTPILSGDTVIGVFGLIAFNQTQRNILLNHPEVLFAFIKKMGEMIVAKSNEQAFTNQLWEAAGKLQAIMNAVNEGILAVDAAGRVTHINDSATAMLGFQQNGEIINCPVNDILPFFSLSSVITSGTGYLNKEVSSAAGTKKFLSTARPIIATNQVIGAVATLRPIEEVKQLILDYTEQRSDVTIKTIIGKSNAIEDLRKKTTQFAAGNSTILIRGESGTGKELLARAIHNASPRKNKPFVAINCSAIPDTLLESELFGYDEGAFTGATRRGKLGKFEMADHGSIFLDEIGDMSIHLQAKMLRALQEKVIERVGGNTTINVDIRIIAATNRPLETMIQQGEFREDLYYRLNVIPLYVTPLRERKEDITPLLEYFSTKYNKLFNKKIAGFSHQALAAISAYDWPGNVRELENAIEYAFNLETSDYILEESLHPKLREPARQAKVSPDLTTLAELEKKHIKTALDKFGLTTNGKKAAAAALGIGIATLYRKIKEYNLALSNTKT